MTYIPDPEVLLELAPEELAYSLLQVASTNLQNGSVHRDVIISVDHPVESAPPYPQAQGPTIEIALIEALHWLEVNGLLLPAPGINGNNGFKVFSRRGRALLERDQFEAYRQAASFPKSMLHAFADRVWISLARGELTDAVFIAFRTVEEAVRASGGFAATDVGVDLMRQAFHPDNGPLSDQRQPHAEREALSHLFADAIGSYKNPHSHKTVTIDDPGEAQEMVLLASHLLRIVESRP